MEKRENLYFYQCLEAAKYPRSGYTKNYSLKAVKEDVSRNYITPTRIKVRLINEESEEYVEQITKFKGEK
jgi:hypothetical protein